MQTTDFTGGDTLIPKKNVEEFSDTIKALKNNEHFHLLSLEIFLDKVRACVARALWSVVVQDAKLPNHLEALKDFFLLSNGEFYQVTPFLYYLFPFNSLLISTIL